MPKKVVAVAYHPGGTNAIAPVVEHLIKDDLEVRVIAEDAAIKIFKGRGIESRTPADYGASIETPDSFTKILEEETPDFILTGTSAEYDMGKVIPERAMIRCGKRVGVPTLAVLDNWAEYWLRFREKADLPDKIAVMDELAVTEMVAEGFPRDILVATSNPSLDQFAAMRDAYSPEDGLKVRQDLGIATGSYLILYASQPIEATFGGDPTNQKYLGYTEKTVAGDILDALTEIPKQEGGRIVLLKIHPRREEPEGLQSVAVQYPEKTIIDKSYPTPKAVLASDLVLSPSSTTLLEALYMDRLALSIQSGIVSPDRDTAIGNKIGATPRIYRKEEVKPILERAMFDEDFQLEMAEKRKAVMERFGDGTGRVVALVYDMLRGK